MTEHSHSYPEGATLLPCPFCGKPAAFCCLEAELGSPASFWVNCSCGVETPERRTEEEAVALWNTRPDGVAQAPLPRRLTAENGAKAALIGEFHEEYHFMDEEDDEQTAKVPVSWDTIKRIWAAAVAHFDRTSELPSTDRGGK